LPAKRLNSVTRRSEHVGGKVHVHVNTVIRNRTRLLKVKFREICVDDGRRRDSTGRESCCQESPSRRAPSVRPVESRQSVPSVRHFALFAVGTTSTGEAL